MQVHVKAPEGVVVNRGRDCTLCAHLNVCAVFRAIVPLMESWKGKDEKGTPPFDPTRLAAICDEYLAAYRVAPEAGHIEP